MCQFSDVTVFTVCQRWKLQTEFVWVRRDVPHSERQGVLSTPLDTLCTCTRTKYETARALAAVSSAGPGNWTAETAGDPERSGSLRNTRTTWQRRRAGRKLRLRLTASIRGGLRSEPGPNQNGAHNNSAEDSGPSVLRRSGAQLCQLRTRQIDPNIDSIDNKVSIGIGPILARWDRYFCCS